MQRKLDGHVFLQIRRGTADDVLGHLDLIVGVGVHEVEAVGVFIEIVEVVILNGRVLDLVGGLVALGNFYAVANSAHFDLADRCSLAGVDVLGGENHVKLAVLLDDVALANRTGDDFQSCFSEFLASDQSGHLCPAAIEAVSGCNILILSVDTSVLPPVQDTGWRRKTAIPIWLLPFWARRPESLAVGSA